MQTNGDLFSGENYEKVFCVVAGEDDDDADADAVALPSMDNPSTEKDL